MNEDKKPETEKEMWLRGDREAEEIWRKRRRQSSTPPATPEHGQTSPFPPAAQPSPAGAAALAKMFEDVGIQHSSHEVFDGFTDCDCIRCRSEIVAKAYAEHIVAPARERVGRLVRDNYKLTSERWRECCASEVFQELKHGKYRQVLNLLFDQQISVGKCAQSIAEIAHGTTPLFPEEYVEIDLSKWPDCAVDGCRNKSCVSLDSEHCHPHTKQFAAERELEASREEMKGLRGELAQLQEWHANGRWNIHESGDGRIGVCRGDHERSQGCNSEFYVEESQLSSLRSEVDTLKGIVKEFTTLDVEMPSSLLRDCLKAIIARASQKDV